MDEGKLFRIQEVRRMVCPTDPDFSAESVARAVYGEAQSFVFQGKVERQSYAMTRSEFVRELEEWAESYRKMVREAQDALRAGVNAREYLGAVFDLCFDQSSSASEFVETFRTDPHAAVFRFHVEQSDLGKIKEVLGTYWKTVAEAPNEASHFWVFDAAPGGDAEDDTEKEQVPVVVAKFSDSALPGGKKIALEFITLGCGNAIGQDFLLKSETYHAVSDEELEACFSGSNDIYGNGGSVETNGLNWVAQYTAGKLGANMTPRFFLTMEQYEKVCTLL